jgi:GNAT superfamily N-acetyltransferase
MNRESRVSLAAYRCLYPGALELGGVTVLRADEAPAFGRIVASGYALPDAVAPWAANAHEAGWDCWLALDGDQPAAAVGVFIAEGVGYLGFAATLPEHRGKGGQNALLAARIRHAREAGCDIVVTETGELRDDRPSSSYRNILRSGFAEIAVTANWLRPASLRG